MSPIGVVIEKIFSEGMTAQGSLGLVPRAKIRVDEKCSDNVTYDVSKASPFLLASVISWLWCDDVCHVPNHIVHPFRLVRRLYPPPAERRTTMNLQK